MYGLLCAGLIVLGLGSLKVRAGEERYPAANFEPKVLYQAKLQASATEAADYPAANVTPQVVFQDPELIEATGPLTPDAPPAAQIAAQPITSTKESRVEESISDVDPPYSALGLAAVVIGLAFWGFRRRPPIILGLTDPNPAAPAPSESEPQAFTVREDLEELAEEVEQTTITNRQRANKTKRTRRR